MMRSRNGIVRRTLRSLVFAILFVTSGAVAKDKGPAPGSMTLNWPNAQSPILRFVFGRFVNFGSYGGHYSFTSDVDIQNVWSKRIESANFAVYLIDKAGERIGEATLYVSNLNAGEKAKVTITSNTVGMPATLRLSPTSLPPELNQFGPTHKVSFKINSVPPGASVKVDGQDVGTTPRTVLLPVGKHKLHFDMTGYAPADHELEITPDAASGGEITMELGGLSRDTLQMRDGSTVTGDLLSVSATEVKILVAGKEQIYFRNQVKSIFLVERVLQQQ